MQLKHLLFIFIFLLSMQVLRAQTSCPAVTAGNDTVLPCHVNCTTLTAVPFESGNTAVYKASRIPYSPFPFNTGTLITVPYDDVWSKVIDLPFTFCYFDQAYTKVIIGSNGQICFDTTRASHGAVIVTDNWQIFGPVPAYSSQSQLQNSILGPYQDIDLANNKGAMYFDLLGTAPCRVLVVSWYNCPFYGDANNNDEYCSKKYSETSQIVLYETTNAIEIYIQQKDVICDDQHNTSYFSSGYWNNGDAIEGIVNPAGTVAYTVPGRNATQWTATNDGWRFTPSGPSIVSVNWYQGDSLVSTDSVANVCIQDQTVFTAQAVYTPCSGGTNDTVRSQVTVSLADSLIVRIDSVKNLSCNGKNDGIAYAHCARGRAPLSYGWSNGATTLTITNLAAGTYTFTAEDAFGCLHTVKAVITAPPPITASVPNVTVNRCLDVDSLQALVVGGNSPFNYAWSNGETLATDTGIPSGTYQVTVTDANACTASASGVLTVNVTNDNLGLKAPQINNISCFDSVNGSIIAGASGGVQPYTYVWSNGVKNNSVLNLAPGAYTVTAGDAEGCTVAATYTVKQPAQLVISDSVLTAPTCFGGNDGQLSVTITGGTGAYSYNWNNGQTNATATNLKKGAYDVTVTDAAGCTVSVAFQLNQPPAISIQQAVVDSATCFASATGSVTITASGGTGALNYAWKEVANGNTYTGAAITGLTAGTYLLSISDANGCLNTSSYVVMQPQQLIIDSITIQNVSCNDRSAKVYTEGGIMPYQYLWSAGAPNNQITVSGLGAGTIAVTVTDANGCLAADSVTINPPGAITITLSDLINETCFGNSNGAITLLGKGTTGPYTYAWNNGIKKATISNLAPGTYTVTVTDAIGCSAANAYNITQPTPVLITSDTLTEPACFAGTNGQISVVAGGGTGSLSYKWSNAQTSAVAVTLVKGPYSVTVTDSLGCSVSAGYQLNQPAAIAIQKNVIDSVTCFGTSTGAIIIKASGGTGALNYTWTEASNGNTFTGSAITGLAADKYNLVITDSNSCTASGSYQVKQPTQLVIDSITVQSISCNDRSATVYAEGGTVNYQYAWSAGSPNNQSVVSGLGAGTIAVSVTDANGCLAADSVNINPPGAITITLTALSNETCFGNSNATITVLAKGTTGPYTYDWNNGTKNRTISNLTPGTYTVTVTDAIGCSAANAYNITQPSQVLISSDTLTEPSCFAGTNGQITVVAGGGTGSLSYKWSNAQTSAVAVTLVTGPYSVTVTDSLGCSVSASYQLNQPATIAIQKSVIDSVSCFGTSTGSITIKASGGTGQLNYAWTEASNGNTFSGSAITGLAADKYALIITDSNNCTASGNYQVKQPSQLLIDSITVQSISCNDRSATVYAEGGTLTYQYAWSAGSPNNQNVVGGLGAGTIAVSVTDANGCLAADSVNINPPGAIAISLSALSNETCFGNNNGTITVLAKGTTGPYTYDWSNGSKNRIISNLYPGNYTVTVTDAIGCSAANAYNITQPTPVLISSDTLTEPSCFAGTNGQITVVAGGGTGSLSYKWSNAQTSAVAVTLVTGAYSVTVTDSLGCSVSASFNLRQPNAISILSSNIDSVTCFGTNSAVITVSAAGGTGSLNYVWTEASNGHIITGSTIAGLKADTYSLSVTDANNCSDTSTYQLLQPPLLVIDSISIQNISCNNRGATVYPEGGTSPYQYNWNAGSPNNQSTVSGLSAGTIAVTVSDSKGCVAADSTIINPPGAITISLISLNNETCFGNTNGAITVLASGTTGPYAYSWNSGATSSTIANLPKGAYALTVADVLGCNATNTYQITQPAQLLITGNTSTQPGCYAQANGQISVTAFGGTGLLNYAWNNAQTSPAATNLIAGSYTVTVTDSLGCSVSGSYQLGQPLQLLIDSISVQTVSCGNWNATVFAEGGTSPLQYLWSAGAANNQTTVNGLSAGTATVSVTDANGCQVADSVTLTQPGAIIISLLNLQNETCYGFTNAAISVAASGGTQGSYGFSWSDGERGNAIANLSPGPYAVTVTDVVGCSAASSYAITQPSALVIADSTISPPLCFGAANGWITVNATGGTGSANYAWSNNQNAAKAINLAEGPYAVTITDSLGCSVSANYQLNQPAPITIQNISIDSVECYGNKTGSIAVSATGGTGAMAYSWIEASTGNTFSSSSISGLAAGIYSLSITDANNCSDTASYQLVQPAQLVIDSISVLSTSCHVWSAQVHVEGGTEPYQFLWSAGTANNQMSVADLSAGKIAVSVTDAKACPASDSVTIIQPGNIVITLNNLNNEPCYGNSSGSISVAASGSIAPYSYRWNDAAATAGPVVSGLPVGSYQVDVTDADQCTATQTYAITQPDSLQPGTPQITNIGCAGGNTGVITANPVGGTPAYHYLWVAQASGQSYSTQTISNLGAGSYQLTVTDTNNCSVTVNYRVTAIPLLNFALVVDSITCFGANDGSVLADVTSGTPPYRYNWKGNGIAHDSVFSDAAPGLVTATINDSNNCTCNTCINTVQLTAPSLLTVQNIVVQNALCYGSKTGSIQVNVDGGTAPFNLEWSNGGNSTADSGLQAGVYTLTVSDAHSCKANVSDTITEPAALNLTVTATAAHCFGEANGAIIPVAHGGTPGYKYSWSNGLNGDVDSLLVAGAYSCTVHDANQCATTAEAYVAQPSQIAIFATAAAIKCTGQKNGSIAVADSGGVAPYQYAVSKSGNNFIYNDVPVQGLDTGWYQVQVMDASGCTVQGSAYVPGVIGDDDNVATSPTSCYGSGYKDGSINITVTTALYPPYQYSLDDGSYQATGAFSGVASGQHTVLVQNGNGCTDTLPAFVNEALPIVVQVTPDSLQVEPGDGVPVQVSYENITEPVISWSPSSGLSCSDCPNPVVNTFAPGTYTVTLTRQSDSSACSGSATLHVTLKEHPNVFVPDIFSPNGDGVNDVFLVFGDNIRTIEMKVFNRWGELVYEGDNQFTGWDGTYKGQMQQPGVYAYTVKIFFLDGTQTEKSGAVALVR